MPAIYLNCKLPYSLSVLPSIGVNRADNPQTMVYANLQLPVDTAQRSPAGWWSLTPPSHPYRVKTRRLFSSIFTCCYQQLLFSEVEHPMLPGLSSRIKTYRRQSRNTVFQIAKINIFVYSVAPLQRYFTPYDVFCTC